jgi:hypothetical protein
MAFLPVLAAVGAVVQGVGAVASANANAQAAEYNEQVDKRNQQVALAQGQAEAADQQRKSEESLGRIQAAYGAAGIEFSGDALGVYQDSATQANYDMAKVHYDAQMRSIGYADQANLDGMKAQSYSTAGALDMFDTGINVGTSILKAA